MGIGNGVGNYVRKDTGTDVGNYVRNHVVYYPNVRHSSLCNF